MLLSTQGKDRTLRLRLSLRSHPIRMYTLPVMVYDASETLLVLAAAMCLTQKRIWAHLPIFMLAMFNKRIEPAAGAGRARGARRRDSEPAVDRGGPRAQCDRSGDAGLGLSRYSHHPGDHTQHHLTENVMFRSDPKNYFRVAEVFAPLIRTPIGGVRS